MSCKEVDKSGVKNESFFYTIDKESTVIRTSKPILSSDSCKKEAKLKLTTEDIEKKLKLAEERRKKRNEIRSERTAENRAKMVGFAEKLEKLSLHNKALKDKKNGRQARCEDILDKKKYVVLCKDISGTFETLSDRYDTDLKMAYQLKE